MIIVTGLPLFARRLAEDLRSVDPSARYIALDTYNSKFDLLKFILLLPFAKTVISMNGVSDQSGSLDWVLRFRKKLLMQWMGTDVIIAIDRAEKGTIVRKYIDYARNFADAPWMIEELSTIDIPTSLLHFKYAKFGLGLAENYDKVRALSYVAAGREDFYGLEQIIGLAKAFPDVAFEVIGTTAEGFDYPDNMIVSGWVSEEAAASKMRESAIFLRLTEHDGFSASVTEALSYGAEVLWTHPFPPSIMVKDTDDLHKEFKAAVERVKQRSLQPNKENATRTRNTFTKETILTTYATTLRNLA